MCQVPDTVVYSSFQKKMFYVITVSCEQIKERHNGKATAKQSEPALIWFFKITDFLTLPEMHDITQWLSHPVYSLPKFI